MVAVLFRALDAFRIFDNIYVMTRGAQDTESSSFLTYRQVIEQMQLGLGSALSVLLFISVLLLAFHWARVVWSRTAVQLAAEAERREAVAHRQNKTLLEDFDADPGPGPDKP